MGEFTGNLNQPKPTFCRNFHELNKKMFWVLTKQNPHFFGGRCTKGGGEGFLLKQIFPISTKKKFNQDESEID